MTEETNPQIEKARRIIELTDTHLFLTGKAGTGKTTFLRRLRAELPKRMVVLAPTGIAALNAGGVTIHSFFQLPFTPFLPGQPGGALGRENAQHKIRKEKIKIFRTLELLVIDEISMVRADLLDAVDDALRHYRRDPRPFGGVQLLLIGDLQQLAPVAKHDEWAMLSRYYDTPYFFSSLALKRSNYLIIELEKVYRQSDPHFLSLLNSVRAGRPSKEDLERLNARYVPNFLPKKEDGFVRLVTHNYQADSVNEAELAKLTSRARTYEAATKGKFPEYAFPTEEKLVLKEGAQVMFVKNDKEKRFVNGMIGEVVNMERNVVSVRPKDNPSQTIEVGPDVWENMRFELNNETGEIEEKVDGSFTQLPLKLAWAITIHKSQGLTFDKVMIDASHSFAHGQTYVALSRCRTLEGIVLTSPIPPSAVITDPHVEAFNNDISAHSVDEAGLSEMAKAYNVTQLTQLFTFERERSLFAAKLRKFEEHLYRTYNQTTHKIAETLILFDKQVVNVSSTFHNQIRSLMQTAGGNVSDALLQERVKKGAAYFSQQILNFIVFNEQAMVETDNKAIAKQLKEVQTELLTLLRQHKELLDFVAENGFEIKTYLNERARVLLNDEERKKGAKGKVEKKEKKPAEQYVVPSEVKNAQLFYRLQAWRAQTAKLSNLPAYAILQQKALLAIANYAPTTMPQLLKMPGIGKTTAEKFGLKVLEIVNHYNKDVSAGNVAAQETVKREERVGETTFETSLRLFKSGISVKEIAQRRDLAVTTIYGHLERFIPTGEVQIEQLFAPGHLDRLREYLATHKEKEEREAARIREALGDDITFSEIRIALAHLK